MPRNTGMYETDPNGTDYWVTDPNNMQGYDPDTINNLPDPAVGESEHIPVAIPSPFALIDLVKAAFEKIAKTDFLEAEVELDDGEKIKVSEQGIKLGGRKIKKVVASKVDERLVSQSLDIAELIYNFNKIPIAKQIEITEWNKTEVAPEGALYSSCDEHKNFANVLNLYLKQDEAAYNFNSMNSLAIIKYVPDKTRSYVIGCTSPVTLFFATENEIPNEIKGIQLSGRNLFSKSCPLYNRNEDFQIYYYSMFYSLFSGGSMMGAINAYLGENLKKASANVKNIVEQMGQNTETAKKKLEMIAEPFRYDNKHQITFLKEKNIYTRKKEEGPPPGISFEINASLYPDTLRPLVLQNYLKHPKKYQYLDGKNAEIWNFGKEIVPYKDSESDLSKRTLPGSSITYPYLTVSDFLEDYLFILPYKINSQKYFCIPSVTEGKASEKSYLLPLKKRFFEYFKTEDIGKKCKVEINEQMENDIVIFTLHVPVKNQEKDFLFIELTREYYFNRDKETNREVFDKETEINATNNRGAVRILPAGLTLYPFIKISEEKKVDAIPEFYENENESKLISMESKDDLYRIQLIDCNYNKKYGDTDDINIDLSFYKQGKTKNELEELGKNLNSLENGQEKQKERLEIILDKLKKNGDKLNKINTKTSKRTKKSGNNAGSIYYSCGDFDYIQISYAESHAIVLPKFEDKECKYTGTSDRIYKFAIDFGTTNTHVEYADRDIYKNDHECDIDNGTNPFEINFEKMQIATLHERIKGKDLDKIAVDDLSGDGSNNYFDIEYLIWHEFVPDVIGVGSKFQFPQRTVIARTPASEVGGNVMELGRYNIPFIFEKIGSNDHDKENSRIVNNLKWDDRGQKDKETDAFFQQLLMLIRNMVLKNNDKLSNVKFITFYPSSMDSTQVKSITSKWEKHIKYYFGEINCKRLMESLAPAYYFKGRYSASSHEAPILTIDIGGGTTDVAIFYYLKGKFQPKCMTSLKFAADSLFYSEHGNSPLVQTAIEDGKEGEEISKEWNQTRKYDNLDSPAKAAYMFAKEKSKDYFFTKTLIESDNRLAFIYFYCAIIYHIAEWLKTEWKKSTWKEGSLSKNDSYPFPEQISFSGTGSRILDIVDIPDPGDENKKPEEAMRNRIVLRRLTNAIFKYVSGESRLPEDRLNILMDKKLAKKITCKGGLVYLEKNNDIESDRLEVLQKVHYCWKEKDNVDSGSKLKDDDKRISELADSVKDFGNYFLTLMNSAYNKDKTFAQELKVSEFLSNIKIDNIENINKAIKDESNIDSFKKEERIPYSLFFAPIRQQIYDYLKDVKKRKDDEEDKKRKAEKKR